MSEIDADGLLPNDRIAQWVASGDVTQLTRGASTRYAEAGDTFVVDGDRFEVTSVDRRTLGEFTDADARREGSDSLEAYKRRMERVHGGEFEWDESDEVLTYRFERRD
jgi:hypothetical protein